MATPVPITRDVLRTLYSKYPNPELSRELNLARESMLAAGSKLNRAPEPVPEAPHRMDECMYRARCGCEETGISALLSVAQSLEEFQLVQRNHVQTIVSKYLPSDFRGWVFEQARASSEARNNAAVEALVQRGGTIREKYDLLWKQQWARREALAAIGTASGIWRLAVRYLAGVPQHLIDFAAAINKPDGPTEELRIKFGPVLANITTIAVECRELFFALSQIEHANGTDEDNETKDTKEFKDAKAALHNCAELLARDTVVFCTLLRKVVEESPFFVLPNTGTGSS